jgi:hypothetical protein
VLKPRVRGPYSAGWRAPWKGQWGPIDDGHSRLGRLAARILKELRLEYCADTPLAARRLRLAAAQMALAEMTLTRIGRDKKATRRVVVSYQAAADRLLAQVQAIDGRRKPTPSLADLAALAANGKPRP